MEHILELVSQMLRCQVDDIPKPILDRVRAWYTLFWRVGGGAVNPSVLAAIIAPLVEDTAIETPQPKAQTDTDTKTDTETVEDIYLKTEGEPVKVRWRFNKPIEGKLISYTEKNNAKVLLKGYSEPVVVRRDQIITD